MFLPVQTRSAVHSLGLRRAAEMLPPFAAIVVAGLFTPTDANAYLDPGTGSFILQALVGTAMAIAFTVKLYWRRLKSLFLGSSEDPEAESTSEDGDQ